MREPNPFLIVIFQVCLYGGLITLFISPVVGLGLLVAALIFFLILRSHISN